MSDKLQSNDVRSMLKTMIGTGKAVVQKIGQQAIQTFIENQNGITGQVSLSNLHGGGDVGASSGIVIFTATYTMDGETQTRDLVLRHAPSGDTRLFYKYDLSRQFRVQQALQGSHVLAPEPLWLDQEGEHFGVSAFIMVRAEGVAPSPSAFAIGPLAEASEADREAMIDEVMQSLVKIHQTDIKAIGLENFAMDALGQEPMERCINWYWQTWQWIDLPNFSRLEKAYKWLIDNIPEGKPELTHGDATLQNYLFADNKLSAVLDWEMSCIGRAEMDLALQCVSNEMFAAPKGSGALKPPSEQEWLAYYEKAGGRPMKNLSFFKKVAAYLIVITVSSVQKNMTEEALLAQEPLLRPFWALLES